MTNWLEYRVETHGHEVVEDDNGFVLFDVNTDELYIADMYVVPEARGTGVARAYLDTLEEEAKDNACRFLTCTVDMQNRVKEKSIAVILGLGFRLVDSNPQRLLFYREVK